MRRGAAGRRGLTFLEVTVVIVLLGIMMALAIPNMRGPREKIALRAAAREIAAAGLLARQSALTTGTTAELIIDRANNQWQIVMAAPPEPETRDERRRESGDRRRREDADRRRLRELTPGETSDERIRSLPQLIRFGEVTEGRVTKDETRRASSTERGLLRVTFHATGTSSGMAIQLVNSRDRSLTVDFDRVSGRPEVYEGKPKTVADRLREKGLDPVAYGIREEGDGPLLERIPGEGFTRIGWSEAERVSHYQSVAERLLQRAQVRHTEQNQGAAVAYNEAARWGSR
jgi:prepilin-type N-terminal cleavage/methylation domain-containing protein